MVELGQIGPGHAEGSGVIPGQRDGTRRVFGGLVSRQGGVTSEAFDRGTNCRRVREVAVAASDNGLFESLQGVAGQQLQDANVMTCPRRRTQTGFEVGTQSRKDGRQLPIAVQGSMIQSRRLGCQRHQEMPWIEDALPAVVTAWVVGNHLPLGHDGDAVDVSFHRHRGKGEAARHAIAVAVETHRLVLIDTPGLVYAGVEVAWGQGRRRRSVALETDLHAVAVVATGACAGRQTALP